MLVSPNISPVPWSASDADPLWALYASQLRDAYSAEQQFAALFEWLVGEALSARAREEMRERAEWARSRAELVERILDQLDCSSAGSRCPAARLVVCDAARRLRSADIAERDAAVRDAADMAERFSGANYHCLELFGRMLGDHGIADSLHRAAQSLHCMPEDGFGLDDLDDDDDDALRALDGSGCGVQRALASRHG